MRTPLPPSIDLIRDSWRLYVKNWNAALHVSAWLAAFPLLGLVVVYILHVFTNVSTLALILNAAYFFELFAALWVVIRLSQMFLIQDRASMAPAPQVGSEPKRVAVAFVWIAVLQTLAIIGGSIFFVVPGIWLSTALSFSPLVLLEDGRTGVAALHASANLVKGRWWPTFLRVLLTSLVLSLPFVFLYGLVIFLLSAVGGDLIGQVNALQNIRLMTPQLIVASAVDGFLQALTQMLVLPLLLIAQIKIFHALKHTR